MNPGSCADGRNFSCTDAAVVNAMIIARSEGPSARPHKKMMEWMAIHSPKEFDLYKGYERDDLVVLGPRHGPVEGLVVENLPYMKRSSLLLVRP